MNYDSLIRLAAVAQQEQRAKQVAGCCSLCGRRAARPSANEFTPGASHLTWRQLHRPASPLRTRRPKSSLGDRWRWRWKWKWGLGWR